jgi:hypothetical protein
MACSVRTAAHIFVLVVLLNAGTVIAGGVLHELGHAFLGMVSGCSGIRIALFDGGFAATKMACPSTVDVTDLALGGSLFVVPVAGLFLLLQSVPESALGWVLLGTHLFGAAADLGRTAVPDVAALYAVPTIGIVFILYGENQLIDQFLARENTVSGRPGYDTVGQ